MTYSNLQSFHRGILLQNATAFPADYYAALHNGTSVRTVSPYVLPPIASIHESVPSDNYRNLSNSVAEQLEQAPEKQISPPIDPENVPTISTVLRPAITIETTPVKDQAGRVVWKPGHGLIEKVDKLTGEIYHLVEEYSPVTKE